MGKVSRVLIVDDERQNIKMLTEYLRDEHKIMVAKNGEQALKAAAGSNPPDLILLDIVMPGLDGYEVCRRLKAGPETKGIPVIFVTALDNQNNEVKGFDTGAVDYIAKPFNPAIVRARVNTHLQLKRKIALLDQLAKLDGLTELPNRRRFDEVLETEFRRISRNFTCLSLIMMDIDFFKQYNDIYGHAAGDACLRRVAETIAGVPRRSSDIVARYGGEEFAAILPDTEADGAFAVAEKLRRAVAVLEIPHQGAPTTGFVSISIGLASIRTGEPISKNRLIESADACLYRAKQEGRNRTVGSRKT